MLDDLFGENKFKFEFEKFYISIYYDFDKKMIKKF